MKALVIGGNRFFGRHLASELLQAGVSVTLLNRGNIQDGFGSQVERLVADRRSDRELEKAVADRQWDIIFDQVCFTASEASAAIRIFKNRTPRYVVTSSESVYDFGLNQSEEAFRPEIYEFEKEATAEEDYKSAKRQMESVFAKHAPFELVIVRPSYVVGVDDFKRRIEWHMNRIRDGLPMYFADIDIQSDFIRSDQAGLALKMIGLSHETGAFNCATRGSISLRQLVKWCETVMGRKAVIADVEKDDSHSPYGTSESMTMNTNRLRALGFSAPSSQLWMEDLIHELQT